MFRAAAILGDKMLLGTFFAISPTEKLLEKMDESSHQFNLTGSRFFKTDTERSDWDFFIKDSEEIRHWLTTNGFTRYTNASSYADDGQCLCVFVFGDNAEPGDFSKQIHVQLVVDENVKKQVQIKLLELYPFYEKSRKGSFTTDKEIARMIWKNAFAFFQIGLESKR